MSDPMASLAGMRAVRPGKLTLTSVVGAGAAALLMTMVPAEESGRKVAVTIAKDGSATVQHVSGPQYLKAYLDAVGVATACDGITKGVKMGQHYTEAQCASMLEQELIVHAQGVQRCTPGIWATGLDRLRVAAVSMAYNIGIAGYCGSTTARLFKAGRYGEGCLAMTMWVKAGGKVLPGLVGRRRRERALCLESVS